MGPSGRWRTKGISAALVSAFFLGLAPIFGKQAYLAGFSPLAVVALRTTLASGMLVLLMALFHRPYFYIYPAGLIGCLLAGAINGLGSILYYTALQRLDAGVGQLLYSLYPLFVALWLLVDRQKLTRLTLLRLALVPPAIYLLVHTAHAPLDLAGVALMLGAALLYALHLIINQRVLYDMPAQTVTLYTLLAMSVVVVPAYLIFGRGLPGAGASWGPIIGLGVITFLARLALFAGVKHLGGLQAALLGLAELFVTIALAHWWLGEMLTPWQWAGALLLGASLLLVGFDRGGPSGRRISRWLSWLRPPELPADLP